MNTTLIQVGYGNYLARDKIVAISTPSSAPAKRYIQDARDENRVIDLTNGHRTKSVIFTNCKYLVLAALEPSTINGRLDTG